MPSLATGTFIDTASQDLSLASYAEINKANWDERAKLHAQSTDHHRLLSSDTAISTVVQYDIPLLGSISDLDVVHLQCHIGTDTLSLARLGAKSVIGLDFSSVSIEQAQALASNAARSHDKNIVLRFVEADVYSASAVLGVQAFDLVYTGIGALCWLPSIEKWAQQIGNLLRPGGRLFVREGHPMLWAIDEKITDIAGGGRVVRYPYFEVQAKPVETISADTYMDVGEKKLQNTRSVTWNHGLGEIITALLGQQMEITMLVEHRSLPWKALDDMEPASEPGEWKLKSGEDNLPLSYTLQAIKR